MLQIFEFPFLLLHISVHCVYDRLVFSGVCYILMLTNNASSLGMLVVVIRQGDSSTSTNLNIK